MKEKKYRASITALVFVIILNVALFSVSTVFAAPSTVVVGDAKSKIHEAVRAKYIAAAFRYCFNQDNSIVKNKYGLVQINSNYTTITDISKNKGNLFRTEIYPTPSASVGAELEKEISGKAPSTRDFGYIECQEKGASNITKAFMSQFGIQDYASLICDKDSKQNGLLMPKKDGNINSCEEGTLDALGQFSKNPDGEEYIKKIYNKWAKNNPFAVPYDKLDGYYDDPTLAYNDALTTFELNCSPGAAYTDKIDISTYNFRIKMLGPDGKVVEKYPKMIATTEKDGSERLTGFMNADGKHLNCNELAGVINNSFNQYAKNLNVAEADACNSQEVIDKASEATRAYIAKKKAGDPLTEEEKEEYRTLSEALQKKDFTVDDGKGGKKCLETTNLKISVKDTASDDDSDIAPDNDLANDAKQSYCQENGGFLSWMLCPAIADGAATSSGLLGYITKLTTVHTSIIEQFSNQDSSIYKAWSAFRNIANIGFVIMLLVVVFSQVTNIGISNYNIKKILPKLIITAILVNFSYLIMGVLIDLSQIAGNGVGSLIRSVAAGSMNADASTMASATISAIASMVISAAGVVGTGAVLVSGPALILPVVMFIATALISVFFGFIMLTIRQAAIIMVVVLAPLMMVLYALPNTSAITKKYISTVKALLMLYPMFIFATSAGALASSIIIGTSTEPLMMIVGGLLNVLPYFAIPSMTSKSLAGLGAITGAFDKMRGGALKGASMAGGVFAASEFYKNMNSNFAADKEVGRAAGKLRKYNNMERSNRPLTSGQMRDRARAAEILNKDSKMRAGGSYAADAALSNSSGAGFRNLEQLAKDEAMEYQDKILMSSYQNSGESEKALANRLRTEMETSYEGATNQEKEAHDSRIRALTRVVGATKSGQKLINSMMAESRLKTSGRAMTQLDMASKGIPGFADKHQVLSGQLTSLRGTNRATGEDTVEGLANRLRAEGTEFALSNINGDKLNAMSNADAEELQATGDARFNAALNQLAETGIKNPDIINGLDGAKYEMVHEAQGEIASRMNQTTINLRSGGTAQVFNPPSDFGEYSQVKNADGEIIYTNNRGDSFNASTGQITKGV